MTTRGHVAGSMRETIERLREQLAEALATKDMHKELRLQAEAEVARLRDRVENLLHRMTSEEAAVAILWDSTTLVCGDHGDEALAPAQPKEGSACADRAETVEETHKRWARGGGGTRLSTEAEALAAVGDRQGLVKLREVKP